MSPQEKTHLFHYKLPLTLLLLMFNKTDLYSVGVTNAVSQTYYPSNPTSKLVLSFSENYTLNLSGFLQLLVYVSDIQMELQECNMQISQLRNESLTPIKGWKGFFFIFKTKLFGFN